MSGTPAWVSGGRKPESLNDNDTFAYRKHGNQGSVCVRGKVILQPQGKEFFT